MRIDLRLFSLWLLIATAGLARSEAVADGLLAAGTRWETPYYVVTSDQAGPTVLITGGIHGDEPAGARAAAQIRHWPLARGRLVVVPRANIPGLTAGTRYMPGVPKPHRDLNRNFPLARGAREPRGELARALWEFVREIKPDWVVDLHEGYHFHQVNEKSVGSSIIDTNSEAADEVIPGMLRAVNATIADREKKFVRLRGSVQGSLARAARDHLGAASMTLETTTREQPLSLRTRQHRLMVHTLFRHLRLINPGTPLLVTPPLRGTGLRGAIYDGRGVAGNGPRQLELAMTSSPGSIAWRIGSAEIGEGVLNQFDLVVFPGGSGSKQAAALGAEGRTHVRNFVEDGGGFVGVCAGAYLAAANYPWSLGISNHRTLSEVRDIPGLGKKSMWHRGPSSTVTMELTDAGREILGKREGLIPVRYHNGPIVSPAHREGLPAYRVLAHFRSEVSRYEEQSGTMVDTPAIIAAEFGEGRVLSISPHPESSEKLRPLVARGMRWVARRE